MSLINEALRKAQSERTMAPGLGDDSGIKKPPVNYTTQTNRLGLMIGLSIVILLLLGMIAGLAFVLLNKYAAHSYPQTTIAEPEAPDYSTDKQTSIDNSAAQSIAPAKSAPANSEPETTDVPVPASKPNEEIVDWLAQSKVTGVRITNSSSKVILNNQAFVPGDSVNMTLDLTILKIEAERIIFIDSNNVEYVKLF